LWLSVFDRLSERMEPVPSGGPVGGVCVGRAVRRLMLKI